MARSIEAIRKRKARKAARIRSRKVGRILDTVADPKKDHHAKIRAIRSYFGCGLDEARSIYRDAKLRLDQKGRREYEQEQA